MDSLCQIYRIEHMRIAKLAFYCTVSILSAVAANTAVYAEDDDEMLTFVQGTTNQGKNYLLLSGSIGFGDGERFKKELSKAESNGKKIDILLLNSGGGSVDAGLEMADEIIEKKLKAVVGSKAECYSSCFFLYAAAQERYAADDGDVGVHRASEWSGEDAVDNAEDENGRGGIDTDSARSTSVDMLQVYKQLGVPGKIRLHMIETDPREIYALTVAEKAKMNTESFAAEAKAIKYPSNIELNGGKSEELVEQQLARSSSNLKIIGDPASKEFLEGGKPISMDDTVTPSGKSFSETFFGKGENS